MGVEDLLKVLHKHVAHVSGPTGPPLSVRNLVFELIDARCVELTQLKVFLPLHLIEV